MRVFLAINLPPAVRGALWEAASPLRETGANVAWVAEPKIHLTLKFIGALDEAAIAPLAEKMVDVARAHATPRVELHGVGAFPNFRRPRVVWIGVEPEPRLELLHHDIEVACATLGHELDGRPYRPHLTLGRVREPGPADALKALRTAANRVRFTDEFHARSIDVMQSIQGPGGSTYSVLASAPLKGA
jgi:RNA 2',3'-cyclic 3'-phosphodiesterase